MELKFLTPVATIFTGFFAFSRTDAQPNFQIISPQEGEIAEGDVVLELSAENFKLVNPSDNGVLENVEREGHFHVYLDGSETTYEQFAPTNYVLRNLSPGKHEIRVSLRDNDHTPFGIDSNTTVTVTS